MTHKISWKTPLTDSATTDVEGSASPGGRRYIWADQLNMYRWIRNGHTAALPKGSVVFQGLTDTSLAIVYSLGLADAGTLANLMAGVVVSDSIPIGGFGYIQIYGYNTSINTLGHASSALGDAMIGVSGQLYCTRSTAVGTAPLHKRHILATEVWATASAALKSGFINCI